MVAGIESQIGETGQIDFIELQCVLARVVADCFSTAGISSDGTRLWAWMTCLGNIASSSTSNFPFNGNLPPTRVSRSGTP